MKISIIIPCLNEEKFLPNLLSDLQKQTKQPDEILVVDAGSTDKTLELISHFKTVKIISTAPNIGAQRDLGGKQATGDFLFFLDSDVRMSESFIEQSLEYVLAKNIDMACPGYRPYAGTELDEKSSFFIQACYQFFNTLFYVFQKLSPSGAGSGILVHKKTFNTIGGFSHRLKFDDIDFIRRGAKVGSFKQMPVCLYVSDRRFVRYGALRMLLSYVVLSIFFFFGAFKLAEIVEYKFADYSK